MDQTGGSELKAGSAAVTPLPVRQTAFPRLHPHVELPAARLRTILCVLSGHRAKKKGKPNFDSPDALCLADLLPGLLTDWPWPPVDWLTFWPWVSLRPLLAF